MDEPQFKKRNFALLESNLKFGIATGLLAAVSCAGAFFLASQNKGGGAFVSVTISLVSTFVSAASLFRWNKNRSKKLAKESLQKTLEKVRQSRHSDLRFPGKYL